jgi:hypothetical protein
VSQNNSRILSGASAWCHATVAGDGRERSSDDLVVTRHGMTTRNLDSSSHRSLAQSDLIPSVIKFVSTCPDCQWLRSAPRSGRADSGAGSGTKLTPEARLGVTSVVPERFGRPTTRSGLKIEPNRPATRAERTRMEGKSGTPKAFGPLSPRPVVRPRARPGAPGDFLRARLSRPSTPARQRQSPWPWPWLA